jgi:RNA polymerase sigma-70 factor (ECF subfamily)
MKQSEIEMLFRKHYVQMTRLARTLLYDDEEARDVVSEVFSTLMKSDVAPRNTEGYLLMSVRNRCMNLLEHKSVRAKFEQAYMLEMKSESLSTDDDDRLREVMNYAERHLTEQTLRVFRLRHLQGMKYQEIADELGISRVMVYKHLAQAMDRMKEYQQKIRRSDG